MNKFYFIIILISFFVVFKIIKPTEFINSKNKIYFSINNNENLENIQCPIPMKDRVLNKTEIQCVWASIEMLGRWAEEEKLTNPPLTSRNDCKTFATPSSVEKKLNQLNIKYVQIYRNKTKGIELIRMAMKEKRGCLWSVPGHAMVIVHFDEEKNIFKWVDNSDLNLNIQTSDITFFERNWESWVLVIYGDYSKIENKTNKNYNLKMFENNIEIKYDKQYILPPNKEISISY